MLLLDLAEHGAADALGSSSTSAKTKLDGKADTYGDIGAGLLVGGVVLGTSALIYVLAAGRTELAPAGSTSEKAHAQSDHVRWVPFGFAF
jgi:hypothetical protein